MSNDLFNHFSHDFDAPITLRLQIIERCQAGIETRTIVRESVDLPLLELPNRPDLLDRIRSASRQRLLDLVEFVRANGGAV